jgi:N-acylneuraminate cytidylyltransferase/CMP-N,N'-diacetyllegionaminic acid synthase
MNPLRILGIVPARGGSKGIPRKNLVDLCGKPLIAWSIETGNALVRAGVIARTIVSTDDAEIAEVARRWGADVPFMRPAELATDTAKAIGYVVHALDTLSAQGEDYDAILLLQATAPIRDAAAIAEAVERFRGEGADSLISCYQEDYINDLVLYYDDGQGHLKPKLAEHNKGVRRQDHGPTMVRNGAVYITRTDYLRRTGQLVCDRPMLMRMRKVDSIDLDTPDDLAILRVVMCGGRG